MLSYEYLRVPAWWKRAQTDTPGSQQQWSVSGVDPRPRSLTSGSPSVTQTHIRYAVWTHTVYCCLVDSRSAPKLLLHSLFTASMAFYCTFTVNKCPYYLWIGNNFLRTLFLILFLIVSKTPALSASHSFSVVFKSSQAICIFSSSNVIIAFCNAVQWNSD